MSTAIQQLVDTDEGTKDYHMKKLEQVALSHIGDITQLETPTYEQKRWALNKLKGSTSNWRRCS